MGLKAKQRLESTQIRTHVYICVYILYNYKKFYGIFRFISSLLFVQYSNIFINLFYLRIEDVELTCPCRDASLNRYYYYFYPVIAFVVTIVYICHVCFSPCYLLLDELGPSLDTSQFVFFFRQLPSKAWFPYDADQPPTQHR